MLFLLKCPLHPKIFSLFLLFRFIVVEVQGTLQLVNHLVLHSTKMVQQPKITSSGLFSMVEISLITLFVAAMEGQQLCTHTSTMALMVKILIQLLTFPLHLIVELIPRTSVPLNPLYGSCMMIILSHSMPPILKMPALIIHNGLVFHL